MTPLALIALAAQLVLCSGGPASAKPDPTKVCGAPFGGGILSAEAEPGSLPVAEQATYGVLRRAATPADTPAPLPAGESLSQAIGLHLRTYDPGATRALGQIHGGGAVYLVPGVGRALHLSAACRRALPKGAASFAAQQQGQVGTGPAFCLVEVAADASSSPTVFCTSFGLVADGFALRVLASERAVVGLVPDGVGAVTLARTGGAEPITAIVTDNLLVAPWPTAVPDLTGRDLRSRTRLRRLFDRAVPKSVTWTAWPHSASLQTFPRPPHLLDDIVREALIAGRYLTAVAGSGTVTVCSTAAAPHGKHRTVCSTHHTAAPR